MNLTISSNGILMTLYAVWANGLSILSSMSIGTTLHWSRDLSMTTAVPTRYLNVVPKEINRILRYEMAMVAVAPAKELTEQVKLSPK